MKPQDRLLSVTTGYYRLPNGYRRLPETDAVSVFRLFGGGRCRWQDGGFSFFVGEGAARVARVTIFGGSAWGPGK
jgi:hypothetical protein